MNPRNLPPVPTGKVKKKTGGEILAQTATGYIEAHYKEKFSLQKMAGALYVNGSYLLRAFRKSTGFTPLAYHNHIRCRRAMELLADPGMSVSQIGEAFFPCIQERSGMHAHGVQAGYPDKPMTGCSSRTRTARDHPGRLFQEGNNTTANSIDKDP